LGEILFLSRLAAFFFVLFFCAAALGAPPTVSSTNHPEGQWSNSSQIVINVSYSGATGYSYVVDKQPDTVPDTNVDTTESRISLGSKMDGIYWFHVRAKSSGWSEPAHYELRVDTGGPSKPASIGATAQDDGSILLQWAASQDSGSGISHYNVYRSVLRFIYDPALGYNREFNVRDLVAKKIASNVTETSYTDTNFEIGKGLRFHYKVQPVDDSGNLGAQSGAASVLSANFCNLTLGINARLVDSNISIDVNSDKQFRKGHLIVTSFDGQEFVVVDSLSNVSSLNGQYSLAGEKNGGYTINFSANDDDGVLCSVEKVFIYDTVLPTVDIISPPVTKELSETVQFEVSVVDAGDNPSGIKSVSLILVDGAAETSIGQAEQKEDRYVFDWNTIGFKNGRFKVVARATDNGLNVAEDSALYSIKNTAIQRSSALLAISDANSQRARAVEYISSLEALNIFIPDLNAAVAKGDANSATAQLTLEQGLYFDLAEAQAKSAKENYSSVLAMVSSKDYKSATYSYNQNQLDVFLSAAGLSSGETAIEAKELIASSKVSRKLEILEVKEKETFYVANIEISLKNPDKNSSSFKVVEVIPKKFASSSDGIISSVNFEVLEKDPVLAFRSFDLNGSQSYTIRYGLKQRLTKQQADLLADSDVINTFISPPIVLRPSANISSIKSGGGSSFDGLPSLELNDSTLLIGGVVLVLFILFVVGVVGAAAVYFLFIRKKK